MYICWDLRTLVWHFIGQCALRTLSPCQKTNFCDQNLSIRMSHQSGTFYAIECVCRVLRTVVWHFIWSVRTSFPCQKTIFCDQSHGIECHIKVRKISQNLWGNLPNMTQLAKILVTKNLSLGMGVRGLTAPPRDENWPLVFPELLDRLNADPITVDFDKKALMIFWKVTFQASKQLLRISKTLIKKCIQ